MATRSLRTCPIFGSFSDLKENVLPTYEDVMKCFLYKRFSLKENSRKDPSVKDIADELADKIKNVWDKASIPCVTKTRIVQLIMDYHFKYRTLLKQMKGRKDSPSYKKRCNSFQQMGKKLFDICSCKCLNLNACNCPKHRKVPPLEHSFLADQRGRREMFIGTRNKEKTIQSARNSARKSRLYDYYSKKRSGADENIFIFEANQFSSSTELEADEEFRPRCVGRKRKSSQNSQRKQNLKKVKYLALAEACDRTGVSDRVAALICSSMLCDMSQPSSSYIDKNKIRRERSKLRKSLQQSLTKQDLRSLYFDGRRDKTLSINKENGKPHREEIEEEHYCLVKEPCSEYLGHVSVENGSAKKIAAEILNFLKSNELQTSQLIALGCDGTVINTGVKGGVLRLIELALNKPLHWFVCQLHANELPLRHVCEKFIGKTSGPRGFVGELGKLLKECEKMSVLSFRPIESVIPRVDRCSLSTDQKYLFDIHCAISTGNLAAEVFHRNPGKMSHSRWLTTANRILRLYASLEKPEENFLQTVEFVMKVYTPMWFSIKVNHDSDQGAKNVYRTIELIKGLKESLRTIVLPVVQRNAFYAHPENILFAMLKDDRKEIRELGWRRVFKARTQNNSDSIRKFVIPPLNFSAERYYDIINWQDVNFTEPPATRGISDADLKTFIKTGATLETDKFSCHTQSVERCIKLVTEASSSVCGYERRDGYIRARIKSRKSSPSTESKINFNLAIKLC